MADAWHISLLLASLVLAAFFSGIEMAYLAASRLQIELIEKQGTIAGKILARFMARPAMFIGTSLVGYTLAVVSFGILAAGMLHELFLYLLPPFLHYGFVLVPLQTLVTALAVLVLAEFLPRSFFVINPNLMLSIFAVPMLALYYLLYPVIFFLERTTRFIFQRILKWEYSTDKPVLALTGLDHYLKRRLYQPRHDPEKEVDSRIFHNALEFRTVKVRECMVPRTEIKAVDIADGIEALKKAFIQTGHSKILVYNNTIDDIVGYSHQLSLFSKPEDIRSIITPISVVPDTMLAYELFVQFTTERRSIALVVDEFGGVSGIVTIEDLVEEIVGEIKDEYDVEELLEQTLPGGTYLFSARLEIDYLNEKYALALPVGDYETLGGLLLDVNEEIPQPHDQIAVPPYLITILSMAEKRINIVKLERRSENTATSV